jgi:transcriptional regulator with XRE-family HTH domain
MAPQTVVVRPIWETFLLSENEQQEQNLAILGQAIRQVRERHDVTASELAAATSVEREQIDALEAGQLDPTYELLLVLARGLGIRPSVFIVCAEDIGSRRPPSGVSADESSEPG